MNLEESLKEYKAITLDIMEQINIDGNISFLLNERQIILDDISKSNYDKEEIKRCAESLNLLEIDKEMNRLVKVEMMNIKKKLQNLKIRQQGNQQYIYSIQSGGYSGYSKFDKKF